MHSDSEKYVEKQAFLLDAARETFAKYGFRKTSVDDIARQAGLRKPTVYHYYKSKEAIFSAVIGRESQELLEAMKQAAAEEATSEGKICAFVKTRYRLFKEKINLYNVAQTTIDEVLPLVLEERDNFFDEEVQALSEILTAGVRLGELNIEDVHMLALIVIASMQGLDRTFLKYGKESKLEDGLEMMLEVFFSGIRAKSIEKEDEDLKHE